MVLLVLFFIISINIGSVFINFHLYLKRSNTSVSTSVSTGTFIH